MVGLWFVMTALTVAAGAAAFMAGFAMRRSNDLARVVSNLHDRVCALERRGRTEG